MRKKQNYNFTPLLFLLLILFVIYFIFLTIKEKQDYNVIMISIDTLRADHVGAYGYFRNTTPNIDKIAREGIVFENSISQVPYTVPSHTSLFTSQYFSVHGLTNDLTELLNKTYTFLAEILKQNNYETAAFTGGGDDGYPLSDKIFSYGFDTYQNRNGYSFSNTVPLALEWIEKNREKKFFLFLHGYDVHDPYEEPEPFRHLFTGNYTGMLRNVFLQYTPQGGALKSIYKANETFYLFANGRNIKLTQKDIDYAIASYDGSIAYADYWVGRFFERLDNLGLIYKTIIIVFSDHGEGLMDHGQFIHGELYDENIHVLTVIRHPEIPPKRISEITELIDITPTILDFLGMPTNPYKEQFQGKSLLPLINNGGGEFGYAYSEKSEHAAIRTAGWKLILRPNGEKELYNLKNDPKELINIYSENSRIAKELEDKVLEIKLRSTGKGLQVIRNTLEKDNNIMRIKTLKFLDEKAAERYVKDEDLRLLSVFNPQPAPYPGELTKTIDCPDEFKPVKRGGEDEKKRLAYFTLYATERFTYGACASDLIKYRAIFALIICKDKNTVHKLEIFRQEKFPDSTIQELESFDCNSAS